jgi:hypothetical protein
MRMWIGSFHAHTPTQTDCIDLACAAIATTEAIPEEDVKDTAIAIAVMVRAVTAPQLSVTNCGGLKIFTKEEHTMNLRGMPLGLLGFLSAPAMLFCLPGSIAPASAQCVMTDVSVQVAIRGKNPANQQNNVDMQNPGHCSGNAITQTSSQVYAGKADQVNQIRNSHQSAGGDDGNGVGGPTIRVPVGVKVDVYNPAYDPAFMNRFGH